MPMPPEEGDKVKLKELNATHIGSEIRVDIVGGGVTGLLAAVSHEVDVIDESTWHEHRLALGRRNTIITIAGWGARSCDPEWECEVTE
jgi:hypothetical protein